MFDIESAERIVQIQELLGTNALVPEQREILCKEQSNLWDADHPGRPLEAIMHDVWLVRSY